MLKMFKHHSQVCPQYCILWTTRDSNLPQTMHITHTKLFQHHCPNSHNMAVGYSNVHSQTMPVFCLVIISWQPYALLPFSK
jgi:hypothetical protein